MSFHRVLGGAEESFDAQVLLDPFEEQLDPPAVAVEFGDGVRRQGEVVGEELEGGLRVWVAVFDASQGLRVVGGGVLAGEDDGLVADKAGGVIDRMGITAAVADIGLVADDEEGGGQGQGEQALEVEVGAVHDVEGAGLGEQQVEDLDVVEFAVGDMDKRGDAAL